MSLAREGSRLIGRLSPEVPFASGIIIAVLRKAGKGKDSKIS
jgi:hypothetical protein